MNRSAYIKIMEAAVNLLVVIMVEAGKAPIKTAMKIGENIFKVVTNGAASTKKDS